MVNYLDCDLWEQALFMEVHLDKFYTKYPQMTCQSFKALLFINIQKTKSKHSSGHEEETNAELREH